MGEENGELKIENALSAIASAKAERIENGVFH